MTFAPICASTYDVSEIHHQYFGSGDHEGVRHTFRFKLLFYLLLSAVGIAAFIFWGEDLLRLYMQGEEGVTDAAIATVISRFVELAVIVIWTHTRLDKFSFMRGVYRSLYVPKKLIGDLFIKGLPLMLNETLWAAGVALVNATPSADWTLLQLLTSRRPFGTYFPLPICPWASPSV